MPHLPAVTDPGPLTRLAYAVSRRRFGDVPEPVTLWAHSRRILLGVARFEQSVGSWKDLDPTCKALAVLRSAQVIGCPWCIDFGSFVSSEDVTTEQLRDLHRWRDSEHFTPAQRLCLEYAELASRTPVEVPPELVSALRQHFPDAAVVELAMVVAVENQRSRFNGGLGLGSQGFSTTSCAVSPG
ncbi:MAG: carboxymuconolactone decarboxylase family protein [Frankiales bacterium]|nr:carboxymuconolactone decarboxylase family protein [Frankiales bacterium]